MTDYELRTATNPFLMAVVEHHPVAHVRRDAMGELNYRGVYLASDPAIGENGWYRR